MLWWESKDGYTSRYSKCKNIFFTLKIGLIKIEFYKPTSPICWKKKKITIYIKIKKIYKELTQAKNRMDFYFNEIQKISANKNLIFDDLRNNRTDSLNSIYENQLTYAEEFGIIFSELNHLTKKFDDKKKQIIKIFRRDRKN